MRASPSLQKRLADVERRAAAWAHPAAEVHASGPKADTAVKRIQKVADIHVNKGLVLDRTLLIDRLKLERKVTEGWFIFLNALVLFVITICASMMEQRAGTKYETRKFLERTLDLPQLEDIRSTSEFQQYIRDASTRSRSMQALSSDYFSDERGTIKLLTGEPQLRGATGTVSLEAQLPIRSAFSITAWVQREITQPAGFIVRNVLGTSPLEQTLSWGWHYDNST